MHYRYASQSPASPLPTSIYSRSLSSYRLTPKSPHPPQELLLPPPSTGFVVLRVALRDVDDEDIAAHFEAVSEFVQVGMVGSSCCPSFDTRITWSS